MFGTWTKVVTWPNTDFLLTEIKLYISLKHIYSSSVYNSEPRVVGHKFVGFNWKERKSKIEAIFFSVKRFLVLLLKVLQDFVDHKVWLFESDPLNNF